MDLEVPDHLRPLRERVLRFVEDRVYPLEPVLDRGMHDDQEAADAMRRLMAEARSEGLWALGHPAEIGGGGLSFLDYVYVNEVIGRSEQALWALGTHSLQDSLMLQMHASDEIKERYLLPLVRGDIIQSFGMTEPDVASSDPTQLQASARLEGGEWVINGHKWFTSHAHLAAFTTVMVRTEPEVQGSGAFSMIVVPTDTPGYEIVRAVPTMGSTDGDHCEVVYHDVRVPEGNLIGARGRGFLIGQQRLGPGRIFHCMRWLGQAQRAFDLMCERATTRVAFGSPLADKQFVQEMIFETAAEIRACRLLTLDAARRIDAGDPARVEVGTIKVLGARMLHNAIDRAIQVFGAKGVTSDTPLDRMYRHARFARIYDGPDEVHKATVTRILLAPYRSRDRPATNGSRTTSEAGVPAR
jgi:alkylation response protein AidB-like acyl-CoA dehydrogenase